MKTFNENFEIDRKSKGLKATAKHAPKVEMPKTADGSDYDPNQIYYFFDNVAQTVRQFEGARFEGSNLYLGFRVFDASRLHLDRDAALSDAQAFFNSEIETLREKVRRFEAEKKPKNRSLKAVLTSR